MDDCIHYKADAEFYFNESVQALNDKDSVQFQCVELRQELKEEKQMKWIYGGSGVVIGIVLTFIFGRR